VRSPFKGAGVDNDGDDGDATRDGEECWRCSDKDDAGGDVGSGGRSGSPPPPPPPPPPLPPLPPLPVPLVPLIIPFPCVVTPAALPLITRSGVVGGVDVDVLVLACAWGKDADVCNGDDDDDDDSDDDDDAASRVARATALTRNFDAPLYAAAAAVVFCIASHCIAK
jgi:hypothetical protein